MSKSRSRSKSSSKSKSPDSEQCSDNEGPITQCDSATGFQQKTTMKNRHQ